MPNLETIDEIRGALELHNRFVFKVPVLEWRYVTVRAKNLEQAHKRALRRIELNKQKKLAPIVLQNLRTSHDKKANFGWYGRTTTNGTPVQDYRVLDVVIPDDLGRE